MFQLALDIDDLDEIIKHFKYSDNFLFIKGKYKMEVENKIVNLKKKLTFAYYKSKQLEK